MTDDPALGKAVDLIAGFEGFKPDPYQDEANVWTIGYGSTYLLDGVTRVTENTPRVTEAEAKALMARVVVVTLAKVRGMVRVPITDNQAAALTSLAYNIGSGAVRTSHLMADLNAGRVRVAADRFREWVYAGGHVSQGLVSRREREREVFLDGALAAGIAPPPHEQLSEADQLNARFLRELRNG